MILDSEIMDHALALIKSKIPRADFRLLSIAPGIASEFLVSALQSVTQRDIGGVAARQLKFRKACL